MGSKGRSKQQSGGLFAQWWLFRRKRFYSPLPLKKLASIKIEAVANEVILGVAGISISR
ncbi:MAG: hypothetical protein J6Q30_06050 [Oscillospiraceae bacterium]|nr:hypothetical protein [Oscillospiraceae bacterium]